MPVVTVLFLSSAGLVHADVTNNLSVAISPNGDVPDITVACTVGHAYTEGLYRNSLTAMLGNYYGLSGGITRKYCETGSISFAGWNMNTALDLYNGVDNWISYVRPIFKYVIIDSTKQGGCNSRASCAQYNLIGDWEGYRAAIYLPSATCYNTEYAENACTLAAGPDWRTTPYSHLWSNYIQDMPVPPLVGDPNNLPGQISKAGDVPAVSINCIAGHDYTLSLVHAVNEEVSQSVGVIERVYCDPRVVGHVIAFSPFNIGTVLTSRIDPSWWSYVQTPLEYIIKDTTGIYSCDDEYCPLINLDGIFNGYNKNVYLASSTYWPTVGLGPVFDTTDHATWFNVNAVPPTLIHDPVIIIPGLLGSAEKNGVWLIDPIFHVYDNLIATLKANGYVEGTDLFTFGYDWRNSNVDTAILLKSKIAAIRSLCSCSKIDLVAHSMGGLVARQYIESPSYANDVEQLIFLGTPHLGAPKAYLTWEAGESGSEFSDQALRFLLSREAKKAHYSSLFSYVQTRPIQSIQDLLPTTNYLHDKGTSLLKTYPINYPRNIFLENLNANVSVLLNSGVRITNIVGDTGTSTISTIRVVPSTTLPLWKDGFPDGFNSSTSTDKGLELGRGDGTVPFGSSSFVSDDLQVVNSQHLFLPTDAEGLIYNKLTSKTANQLVHDFHLLNFKILLIKILSPVDVLVTAPDGKQIGHGVSGEVNEIPDAFYSGFETDNEYITIPNPLDGEYKIETTGTGSGEYTVATALVSDTTNVQSDFVGQTQPNLTNTLNLDVSSTATTSISVTPVDNTAPTISIVSPEAKDYVRATTTIISINATSTDAGSGVFSFGLSLNGTKVKSGDFVDTYAQKLGNQTLVASSTDNVGNATSTSLTFRIISTPQSTIDDVERAFALGWIAKKDIKNDIISKLNQATKIEKKIVTVEEKLPGKPKVIKQIEKLETRLDKVLGKAILKDLDAKYPKSINVQAYALLTEDINWLINN